MKYVAVKHKPEHQKIYWFQVSDTLSPLIKVGLRVLCDTRKGKNYGTVVSVIDGIEENEAKKIIGPYFPLKSIIGVETTFNIEDIHVPLEVLGSNPQPGKIARRISEFYKNGKFSTKVIFYPDGTLADGYTAYLVAKMFDHSTLSGFCI